MPRLRRQAIAELIRLLPMKFQQPLTELFRQNSVGTGTTPGASRPASHSSRDESVLCSALGQALNQATLEGSLSRRAFLNAASIITSAGLWSALFPRSAEAAGYYNLSAFWKKRSTAALAPSGYPVSSGSDPYWDYVVLLMNMDTASGVATTVFADDSNVGKSPTISGSPYIDNGASSSPYSGRTGSAAFLDTSSYLTFTETADHRFGTNDFTIEFYFKWNGSNTGPIISKGDASNGSGYHLCIQAVSGQLDFRSNNGSVVNTNTTYVSSSGWTHVALARSGSTINFFINGTIANSTSVGGWNYNDTTYPLRIASYSWSAGGFNIGRIADLRVYNGVAKYTANFTAPTSPIGLGTANDKYWGYCVLACPFENSLKDMSGKRVTSNNSLSLTTSVKKFGSASSSLNGMNQYLSVASSSDFNLGESPFTVEAWVRFTTVTGSYIVSKWANTTTNASFYISWDGANWRFRVSNSSGTTNDALYAHTPTANQWYHVAACYDGSRLLLFLDGALVAATTLTVSINNPSIDLEIGRVADGGGVGYFPGQVDSLRITKGYARYTSSFTVPSASFPVGKDETVDPFWSYTVLAMHMDDFTDSTGRHTASSNSGSTSSTKLYGTGSAYYNGTGQYTALADHADWQFGTGDFTIEFWVNPQNVPSYQEFLSYNNTSSDAGWNSIRIITGGGSAIQFGNANAWANTGSCVNGAWYHIACVRASGTFKIYRNGILESSFANTTSFNTQSGFTMWIGRGIMSSWNANCYLDDLRITKGIARYTQNFTPPTRAFATTPVSTYNDYDPFFANLALLMNMDGSNGSTNFIDDSLNSKSISIPQGTPQLSTTQSKFGGSSLYLDGSSRLSVAAHNDFSFGSSDFTIEYWLYATEVTSTYRRHLSQQSTGSNWYLRTNQTDGKLTSGNLYNYSESTALPTNTWHHIALSKSNGRVYLFRNGQLLSSGGDANTWGTASGALLIGGDYSENTQGYIDSLRITKGVARYTAAFTPPTAAFSPGFVTSGLVAFLDAGNSSSYDGTSQTWKNMWAAPADGPTTWNSSDKGSAVQLYSNGFGFHVDGSASNNMCRAIAGLSSGKYYWEVSLDTEANVANATCIGIAKSTAALTSYLGSDSNGYAYRGDGTICNNGSSASFGNTYAQGTIIGIALDLTNGKVFFSKNGVWQNSGDPASGTGYAYQGLSGTFYPAISSYGGSVNIYATAKFNSRSWTYSPPSGFSQITSNQTAYDFYLGSGSGSDSADPTFVGVAGGRSANDYFSLSGTQYFTLSGANTAFISSMHQANASFTIVGWIYHKAATYTTIFSTGAYNSNETGVIFKVHNGNAIELTVSNGTSFALSSYTSSNTVSEGWHMVAISFTSGGSSNFFYLDGAYVALSGGSSTWSATYSSPSASTANWTAASGIQKPGAGLNDGSGNRIASVQIYNRALTKAELDQNFNALRTRFGI